MKLFTKPSWMKPEVDEPIYWLHLLIIALVIQGVLQVVYGGNMFAIKTILWSIPLLAIGDIVAHTLLKLD